MFGDLNDPQKLLLESDIMYLEDSRVSKVWRS